MGSLCPLFPHVHDTGTGRPTTLVGVRVAIRPTDSRSRGGTEEALWGCLSAGTRSTQGETGSLFPIVQQDVFFKHFGF